MLLLNYVTLRCLYVTLLRYFISIIKPFPKPSLLPLPLPFPLPSVFTVSIYQHNLPTPFTNFLETLALK